MLFPERLIIKFKIYRKLCSANPPFKAMITRYITFHKKNIYKNKYSNFLYKIPYSKYI